MVSKKNFQQNGRGPLQRQGRGPAPYQKPFKPQGGNNSNLGIMFNASQIPDSGFMDFNNPTPPVGSEAPQNQQQQQQAQQKKKNNKNKPKNKPQGQLQQGGGGQQQQNGNNWNRNRNPQQQQQPPNRFGNGPQRGFNNQGRPMLNRGRRMMPPIGLNGPRGGPMPPLPPHHLSPNGFQIPPMIPPMPPMGRGPMPPLGNPHFLRRGGRGGPMPPIPPPMPLLMGGGPRTRRNGPPIGMPLPPVPFNGIGPGGKVKKPNPKLVKKVVKGKSTIRTLKNLANQYTLDKPWVNTEIRAEHDKKVDIENRLKGNKDDDLFAQFKAQRDKFVSMYETAREAYLKQEAEAVKAKDDKDKQTNKTAANDGNKKEANANAKANANTKAKA